MVQLCLQSLNYIINSNMVLLQLPRVIFHDSGKLSACFLLLIPHRLSVKLQKMVSFLNFPTVTLIKALLSIIEGSPKHTPISHGAMGFGFNSIHLEFVSLGSDYKTYFKYLFYRYKLYITLSI